MDIAYSYHDALTAFVPIQTSVSRGFTVYGLEMQFHRRRPGRLVSASFCYIDAAVFRGDYGHVRLVDATHPHREACCTVLRHAAAAKTTPASLAALYRAFLKTVEAAH